MLKKLLLASGVFLAAHVTLMAQPGTLQGKIIDGESKEAIPYANIIIESDGKQAGGTMSDFNGNYSIKPIPPGKYDVRTSYVGYADKVIQGVIIRDGRITFLDVEITSKTITLETAIIVDYKVPLIEKDGNPSGGTATSEEIKKMAARSASSVAITVGGVFSQDGELGSIRGQRSEGTVMYIDGVRVRGSSSLPKSALEQVTVITGGLPAMYGDATGGVVSITTKGASRKFGAGIELLSSQMFDSYGDNLLGFNIQGPLIKGDSIKSMKTGTSLFGFFLSGELSSVKDGSPSAIGYWKVKDDVLDKLTETPLRPSGTGFGSYSNAEFIKEGDLEKIKAKLNSSSQGINLSGKLDVRTTPTTNLTFGGNLNYDQGYVFSRAGSLLNFNNNSYYRGNTWRVFGRFTQRFINDTSSKSILKNVFYQIQADYSRIHNVQGDKDHMDNLFDYGYIGKFKTHKIRSYELGADTVLGYSNVWIHNGFRDTLFSFERSEINPELANYTSQYYDIYPLNSGFYSNSVLVQEGGGLLNGQQPRSVYGLWQNVGAQYNGYSVGNYQQIGINANGSADIGNHAFQFGFQYEQRSDRYYGYSPVGLWTLMRQITNSHIIQLDKLNPQPVYVGNVFQDTINYNRLYDQASQYFFDYNLRNKLGLATDGTDWIDIDNYDPSTFSIDMFSADELLNNGNSYVYYQGYDHTGKLLKNKPSFDDFFTKKDAFGNYTREIGAFEPIYMAGYVNDKFAIKDLVFNVGLRVDRFDANQKVLKDPYLMFPAKTVKEVNELGTHPTNMGSDFVVYVNDVENPSDILGYRSGSTWYNASGAEITDPALIETASGIAPYLVDPKQKQISSNAFKDYEPQINLMPRISFSFDITDEALFFAHYDVLTKRPTSGMQLDPLDYFFIQSRSENTLNNPALQCEQTVDYELGFQQVLKNKKSSLKLSAYYREMRNLVQAYRFSGAYPVSYYSYNNIDFGTVKGLTLTYDLRQSGNVWMKASYTLQFADGTGSDATSAVALIRTGQPNLRTTNPVSFDRRHAITMVLDYRYGSGKDYNGPKLKKIIREEDGTEKVKYTNLLENAGANFTFTGGSGVPYSKSSKIVPLGGSGHILQGSINGSRLPWQFKIDARFDKDIELVWTNKSGEKTKTYLNVFLEILNVLNAKNVMGVYRATGNPDDDGYLAAAEYQTQINQQLDPQSYRDLYLIAVNSPYNYSLPRRARLGVALSF